MTLQKEAFEEFGIDDAIVEALNRTVKLKHGGNLHIEETRAFVAIDVDSAGKRNVGDLDSLNIEAAKEIARQIRLRNLSGKIIIDFAGSSEYRFMKKVMETLEEELADDIEDAKGSLSALGGDILEQQVVDGGPGLCLTAGVQMLPQEHKGQTGHQAADQRDRHAFCKG